LSFTALSQSDTTKLYTFTHGQVQTFLITKVERDNCYERYDVVTSEKELIYDTLNQVRLDNTTLQKKVVKNRRIAIGGFAGFFLALGLFFVH
jgi:hypothetical protein